MTVERGRRGIVCGGRGGFIRWFNGVSVAREEVHARRGERCNGV